MTAVIDTIVVLTLLFVIPIPIILLLVHHGIGIWRNLGRTSYIFFAIIWAIADVIIMIFRDALLSSKADFSALITAAGVLMCLYSFIMQFITMRSLGFWTMLFMPELKNRKIKLVNHGIYRKIRHPRYSIFLLGLLGIFLLSGYLSLLYIFIINAALFYLAARAEEKELISRLGREYADYMQTTGMFLPKF